MIKRRRRLARPRRTTEKEKERIRQEDQAGYYSILIGYPAEFYFEHGWEPEVELEDALADRYHPDMVLVGGSGMGIGSGVRDLHVIVKGYAKELEGNPKRFIKEVVQFIRKTLSEVFPGLNPRNIHVEVTHFEWNEELDDIDAVEEFTL